MKEVRTLFEKFWICKDTEKETYYKVKRDIPNFQRFVREQLGWKLIHTEKLLKLEKKPAHAEPFMGSGRYGGAAAVPAVRADSLCRDAVERLYDG